MAAMRYVQRDKAGKVVGHFANPQSYAQEALPEGHPDLQAYQQARSEQRRAARQQSPAVRLAELERRMRELEAQVAALRGGG